MGTASTRVLLSAVNYSHSHLMINATQNAQPFFRNQHQAAESRQAGAIQAPTPSADVLAAIPQGRLGGVAKAADTAERFKQELQEWVDQAPIEERRDRKKAAKTIFEVYENAGKSLQLGNLSLTSMPSLVLLSNLQTLVLYDNKLDALAENPHAATAFFEELSQLSNLELIRLPYDNLDVLAQNPQTAIALFEGLGQLRSLQTLELSWNDLGAFAAANPYVAKAIAYGLGQLRSLQTLRLDYNHLGAFAAANPYVAQAIADGLGQLRSLQTLKLSWNDLGAFAANPQAAKAFFAGVSQLSNLQILELSRNDLGAFAANPQAAEAIADGLGQLRNLRSLDLSGNNFGALVENPQAAKIFLEGLGQLRNLQTLNLRCNELGRLFEDPQTAKVFFKVLSQLGNLQTLILGQNELSRSLENPQIAQVFFDGLGRLSNLQYLDLQDNDLGNLAKNQQIAKAFFDGLGQLSHLQGLNLSRNELGNLAGNPKAAIVFFEVLSHLSNLQTLDLMFNKLGNLAENPQAAKVFFEGLGQLGNLQILELSYNGLGALAANPQTAKDFAEGLGKLSNLQTLDLSENHLDYLTGNTQAAYAFIDGLGKLRNLRKLSLNGNAIFSLYKNQEVARAFLEGLRQFRQLRELGLEECLPNYWIKNPQLAKLFFDVLGSFSHLRSLDLYRNRLHEIFCDYPVVTEALFNCVVQLEQLQNLSLPSYFDDNGYGEDWCDGMDEDPRSVVYDQVCDRFTQLITFRASLRQHHIESESTAIIEQGQLWTPTIAEKLFERCATLTDAVSAYELLTHVHDKGELSWPEVQSNLKTVCLAVATNLIGTDTQGEEALAKVRNQEMAYLLSLVQHGAKIGALTSKSAFNIQLHIQNGLRINQAFSAIQALQQNQQAMLGGLQAVGNALGQHIQHTAQLQAQYKDCFQQLANNQQQLQNKQNQLALAHGSMREILNTEIETLRSNQARIGDNLHQVGLKMLSAQRIRAIGSAVATGVAFLPWVGAGIAEAGRAIASAIGVAKASGFASGLESLKDSLASMGNESIFQTPPAELQKMTLGETLQGHGIQLPDDSVTTLFTSIELGTLAQGIGLVSNVLANRQMEAAATTLAAFPEHLQKGSSALAALPAAPEEQADSGVAVPAGAGQHAGQGSTPPALPTPAQPADSADLVNLPASQAMQLDTMKTPERPATQANDQQSHRALLRTDSTGSLATVDEEKDELAAAIKFFDENNPYSVEQLNNMVQDAIADEQQALGSTSLTDKFLPTRNSNTRHATAVDLATHYGRPQVLVALNTAARATRNAPTAVKLKSAQGKVFSRALSEATSRQGIYDSLGKRINPTGEKIGKTEK